MGSKLGALRFPTLLSDRRTIHRHSPPKCSKGLRCLCRKPFAFKHKMVAGVRFELTTFGLCVVKRITPSLPFNDLRSACFMLFHTVLWCSDPNLFLALFPNWSPFTG